MISDQNGYFLRIIAPSLTFLLFKIKEKLSVASLKFSLLASKENFKEATLNFSFILNNKKVKEGAIILKKYPFWSEITFDQLIEASEIKLNITNLKKDNFGINELKIFN